jgi:hypothetical protein
MNSAVPASSPAWAAFIKGAMISTISPIRPPFSSAIETERFQT